MEERKHRMRHTCVATWSSREKIIRLSDSKHKDYYARGLTKTIKATFTPEFSYSISLRQTGVSKPKKHGCRIGNHTDRDVQQWCQDPNYTHDENPYFVAIQNYCRSQQWTPLHAQIPVGCTHLRIGTLIDLLVLTQDNTICLIEIKTGYDDYYDLCQGPMSYPFHALPTSFRNNHFLQLMFTIYLFLHSPNQYNELYDFKQAMILHVYESVNSIVCEPLPLPVYFFNEELLKKALLVCEEKKDQNKRQRNQDIVNGSSRAKKRYKRMLC